MGLACFVEHLGHPSSFNEMGELVQTRHSSDQIKADEHTRDRHNSDGVPNDKL